MAKPIIKKVRAMRWQAWVNLMLAFTLIFSVFMLHGLYAPYEAQAAVAWQASSAIAASTGANVTVTLPAHQANDIFLLQVWVRDVDDTVTVAGWTQIATIDRGTTSRYWWFWMRAASGAETNPTVSKSTATGDTYAAVTTYLGAITTGDPWEVKGTASTGTTNTAALNGITTLTAGALVVASIGGEDNLTTTCAFTATNPASLTTNLYVESNQGADGACSSGSANRAAAGATGTVNAAWDAVPLGWGGIVLALKPQPVAAPTLSSPTATGIGSTTATLGANITSDGGASITQYGTCWGTTAAPTGNCSALGAGSTGVFTDARTGLTAGTKLFYRGYATNSAGTAYSPDGSFYTEPATQASGINFTSVGSTSMTVNWTRGSGGGVIVLMKQGSAVDTDPSDGTYTGYTANSAFGGGTQIGTGNYVVYKGTGTNVAVTGLSASTTYYVAVYEFSGTVDTAGVAQGTNYKLTPATGNQATTGGPVAIALNHNSTTTSSSKWPGNGGWGLTGTKYGEFVCATCHEPRATIIKSIKTTITAPVGSFPGPGTVTFSSTTSPNGFGNDSIADGTQTPRTSSTKICEVCHTYDSTGGSGTTAHPYNSLLATLGNHQSGDNTDCTSCHKHNKGFDAACDVCHGNPPGVLAFDPGPTGSTTAGKHATHVTTLSFICDNCHKNYLMPESPKQLIDIGFSMWTKTGAGTTYGAANEVTVGDGYKGNNSTTIVADNTRNCSTLYCHGAFSGGLTATPTWATGTAACGTCHANTAASATSLRASHIRHAGNAAGGLSVLCEDCHKNGTAYTLLNGHVNGKIAWSLKTTDNRFGATAKYNAAISGEINNVAPSPSYQTCETLYCHSNVQSGTALAGPTSYGTPRWGGGVLTCTAVAGCHDNPPATPTANSAHTAHTAEGYSFTCAACHNNGGYTTTANHANGTLNMTVAATYGGTYIQGDHTPGSGGYGTCSNVYCHGAFSGGLTAAPSWAGTAACGTCHANSVASATSLRANHPRHAGSAAGQLSLLCTACHPSRVAADGHVDLSVQWDIDRLDAKFGATASYNALELGSTGAKAPSASYANCTNVYCHSNVQSSNGTAAANTFATVQWGAASVTCDSCHGQAAKGNGQPSTGSHAVHATNYSYACAVCHNNAGDETTSHANRTIDLSFNATASSGSAAYSQGSHTPGSGGYGNCSSTKCHGTITGTSVTPDNWGTDLSALDACTVCHGTKITAADYGAAAINRAPGGNATGVDTNGDTAATDSQVGAHDTHLRSLNNYSSDIACTECHSVPASASTTNIAAHLDGLPANMTWGTVATTNLAAPSYTSPNCTNTYCHFGKSIGLYPPATANASVSWTNTAYLNGTPSLAGDCGKCHLSPPATTGSHNGVTNINQCNTCHNHVTTSGTFFDATKHINGAVDSSGGTCLGCHASTAGTLPRRAIKGEFGLTFGHRKSGRAAVTNNDCCVCHMEGNPSDGSINTTYHNASAGNGKVELRNPDTGALMVTITLNTHFQRDLSSNTIEAVATNVQNFCLACHDGTFNATAIKTPLGGTTNPWNNADPAPVNVDTQFATTNTSFHPVKGVQNNSFCDVDTMMAPWNVPNGTHKLITCFDCHAGNGVSGTQTSTVVAHGNAVTLRADIIVTVKAIANPLCVVCHNTTIYWGANVHSGAGSGWSGNTEARHQPADHWGCTSCHGVDNYATAAGTQTTRAEAAHGFNTAGEYAFLRGSSGSKWTWDTTNPRTTCDNMNCGTGRSDSGMTYTPGGTY